MRWMRRQWKKMTKDLDAFFPFMVLGIVTLVSGMVLLISVTSKDDTARTVVLTVAGLVTGSFGLVFFAGLILEWRDRHGDPIKTSNYCPDCGEKLVQWAWQRGFDEHTGKPKMKTEWRCPDWTQNSYSATSDSWACGNTKKTEPSKLHCSLHSSMDTSCSACLNDAVAKGTFTRQEADLLRAQ